MIEIFVVCKNPDFVRNIQTHLTIKKNILVTSYCKSSEQALEEFKQHETQIVLMDIEWKRHKITGEELIKSFLQYNSDLRIIGFTNSYNGGLSKKFEELGAWGYIYRTDDEVRTLARCVMLVNYGVACFIGANGEVER